MESYKPVLFHKRVTTHAQHVGPRLGVAMGTPVLCDDVADGPGLPHIATQRLVSVRRVTQVSRW